MLLSLNDAMLVTIALPVIMGVTHAGHRLPNRSEIVDDPPGLTGSPWTRFEIDEAVSAYLGMLRMEHSGQEYVKANVVRGLGVVLPVRSRGSIERKFQNISAILDQLGRPWIDGYKPLTNYQRDLRDAVITSFRGDHRLAEGLADYGAAALPAGQLKPLATDDVVVGPPGARIQNRTTSSVSLTGGRISALADFQTKPLGDAGEGWVVDLEREQLRRAGRPDLADQVVWAAKEIGDGLGYDVASFRPDGRERLIEVKTTNYGIRTPFYITRWEVEFSDRRAAEYSLYRVHGFVRDPRIYVLDGSISATARLEPSVYLGLPA